LLLINFVGADISTLTVGKSVTVGDGTTTVTGVVMAAVQAEDPVNALLPHTHPVATETGLPA